MSKLMKGSSIYHVMFCFIRTLNLVGLVLRRSFYADGLQRHLIQVGPSLKDVIFYSHRYAKCLPAMPVR